MKDFGQEKNSPKTFFDRFFRNFAKFTEKIAILAELHVFSAILFIFVNFAKFLENLPKKVFGEFFSWSKFFMSEMVHQKESYSSLCALNLKL